MKILIMLSFFIPMLVLLTACPMERDRDLLTVYNNADHSISFFLADYYSEQFGDPTYPDTTLSIYREGLIFPCAVKDKPTWNEISPLEDTYKRFKTDTLCFFIFDTDTLNKYDWTTIRNDYKILQRYDLSLQDFIRLKRIITYPPDERMKDIKMWPPYGSKNN